MLNSQVTYANISEVAQLDMHEIERLCQTHPREVAERFAPLIGKVVGRMARRLPPYAQIEDLYSVGALGLMDAIEKFRADRCTDFACYAEHRIRGAVLDELRHLDPMPRVLRTRQKRADRALRRLTQELGREPSEVEAAAELEMSLGEYQDFRAQVERTCTVAYNDEAVDHHTGGASTSTPGQVAPVVNLAFLPEADDDFEGEYDAFKMLLRREKMELIARRIAQLDERDQLIMALHYQEGLNFRQIGQVLGLTESRISQIHKAIIMALRSQLECLD